MLKIGDFSQLGQVSVRTLRHYEELGLLKPAKVDCFTDYRYYSLEQLPRLNRILALKDLGFSLTQIKQLLARYLSVDQLRGMLMIKQGEIERQLQEGQVRLLRVEARLKQIEQEGKLSDYEVVLKQVEPQMIASARITVPRITDMIPYRGALYTEVYNWLRQNHTKSRELELAVYHNPEYTEQDIDLEVAVTVEKASLKSIVPPILGRVNIRQLPAVETMASVIHNGKFRDAGLAMIELFNWMGINGYSSSGAWRELHLFGQEFTMTQTNGYSVNHAEQELDLFGREWYCNDSVNFDDVVIEMQIPVERL